MKCSEKMNLLKKDERVLLLNFEEGPGVPLLNFQGNPQSWVPGSQGSGSRGPCPTFTKWQLFSTVDEILWKKVSTLRHFLNKYFLFSLNIIEIQ